MVPRIAEAIILRIISPVISQQYHSPNIIYTSAWGSLFIIDRSPALIRNCHLEDSTIATTSGGCIAGRRRQQTSLTTDFRTFRQKTTIVTSTLAVGAAQRRKRGFELFGSFECDQ